MAHVDRREVRSSSGIVTTNFRLFSVVGVVVGAKVLLVLPSMSARHEVVDRNRNRVRRSSCWFRKCVRSYLRE